jgi:glycosyltransferase involved in cell wall biosynthesis
MTAPAPQFSVLTPVYNPAPGVLREAIESVQRQTHPDWELILVDDCSTRPEVREVLAEAEVDPRIRVLRRESNGGIGASSQDALDAARGEFVALLDHDDLLAPQALSRMADAIAANPAVDYLYSDEDKLSPDGVYYDAFRKPQWSPERLRGQMYTAHLSVLRTGLVRSVGGFRSGFDGSQDHDLALRVTEQARRVVHIPEILYHWRVVPGSTAGETTAKDYAWDAGLRAVADHVRRSGIDATAHRGPLPGTYRLERRLPADLRVSIVIPSRGSRGLVWGQTRCFIVEAVRSVLARTEHQNLEIVAVLDTSTPPRVERQLREIAGDRLVVVEFDEPFNFSRKCNTGFLAAHGDVVVMLNDDTEITSDRWLETLVAPLQDRAVGLTGAKLFYQNGTVQHGGHLYDRNEFSHAFLGAQPDSTAGFSALHIDRECVGVTAACSALRRETFEEIGGFCEALPGNFNDVDFSMKVRHAGYRIVWLAHVEAFHFESRTRDPKVSPWEVEAVTSRWGTYAVDPYLPFTHEGRRKHNPLITAIGRRVKRGLLARVA